jgi:hypothetical protein
MANERAITKPHQMQGDQLEDIRNLRYSAKNFLAIVRSTKRKVRHMPPLLEAEFDRMEQALNDLDFIISEEV